MGQKNMNSQDEATLEDRRDKHKSEEQLTEREKHNVK